MGRPSTIVEWIPAIKYPVSVEWDEWDKRFIGSWEDLREAGIVDDFLLDMIQPSGNKTVHTPFGQVWITRRKRDWCVKFEDEGLSHLLTHGMLRYIGLTPILDRPDN